jgi:hypothetical protein
MVYKGRNVGQSQTNTSAGTAPMNILDLVINQEASLLKYLPEEERTKYEEDKVTFMGASRKTNETKTNFDMIGGLDERTIQFVR